MAIERERKFLLKYMPELPLHEMHILRQAYLMIAADRQLRVRLVDDDKAYICYKQKVNRTDKHEFEYEIPFADGLQLYEAASLKLTKTRHSRDMEHGQHIDIDIYPEEIGFHIVEIEYSGDVAMVYDFCGEDVTGKDAYSNIRIAELLSKGQGMR